ncbi:MAG: integrase [Sphingomonas sp.]|nr:integrase [Sphingomonas sp.]
MITTPTSTMSYTPAQQAASLPIGITVGGRFRVDGRDVRLDRVHDDETVELVDQRTLGLLRVKNPETGELVAPTLDWMRTAYRDGRFHALDEIKTTADLQGRHVLLDPDACSDRDPKSKFRLSLANRANLDGVKLTDAACGEWLDRNYGLEKDDLLYPKPGASSLRRWTTKVRKHGKRQAVLVSQVGRKRGSSQLDAVLDALVHEAALFYWTRPEAEQKHAYAWLCDQVDALNAARSAGTDEIRTPSREALRQRIHRLRCHDTVKAKHGQKEADRLFVGSDQAITAVDLLEIGLMDATTLEQVIVFDDDWALPACRVRITALMDLKSTAITGFHVYAGPNRAETSIETIIASMTPPDVPPAMLKRHPILGWMFGKYARLLPDNEKALIGPSTLPSINEVGIDVMPAPVDMPTAKAALERFWRTLKDALRQVPGTIIDPKRAKEMDIDAIDAACLTLPQLRALVAQVVAAYNSSPCRGLDGQSPALVWQRHVRNRATRGFEDIAHVRRVLGRTDTALLTFDGIEKNGIRYRDAATVTRLLDNLAHTQPVRGRRKDGTVTIEVKIRISPGNLDAIQVWDPVGEEWASLPSSQPLYTHQLSEWEHREFTRMAAKRNEPFASERDRLISKAETMRMIDEMAPALPFQQRRNMAALYVSQQVKRLAGSAADTPPPVPLDEIGPAGVQGTMEVERRDDGRPATNQKSVVNGVGRRQAPPRDAAHYATDTRGNTADFDWDDVDVAPPADEEIGYEPPTLDEDWSEREA